MLPEVVSKYIQRVLDNAEFEITDIIPHPPVDQKNKLIVVSTEGQLETGNLLIFRSLFIWIFLDSRCSLVVRDIYIIVFPMLPPGLFWNSSLFWCICHFGTLHSCSVCSLATDHLVLSTVAEADNLSRCEDDLGQYIYIRINLRQDIRILI